MGEEVVQFYIHDRVASRVRPIRELKGFVKILLEPGQARNVTFSLTRDALTFSRATPGSGSAGSERGVEPGMFDVWVSPHSAAGKAAEFELLPPC